jgi:hypothetical protein
MLRLLFFIFGMSVLIGIEIVKVYFIMPFPGSQVEERINVAYFIHNNIWAFRLFGLAFAAYPAFIYLKTDRIWVRWPVVVVLGFWLFVAYQFNFRFLADKMFVQPETKTMKGQPDNKVPMKDLVVGVTINGESKAYPVEIIGYHHQVRDTIGGKPVMVTYCTVCRTGRVFEPLVDGQADNFRLVGMDHFNAMFEDSRTGSWWRQVNGEAITGELKGKVLPTVPSEQMSLGAWLNYHPASLVMQPDSLFLEAYQGLADYDEGKKKGNLERRDSLPWMEKSWVVGVQIGMDSKAFDWIALTNKRVMNDKVGNTPVVVALEQDSVSFHVWERADTLTFKLDESLNLLADEQTNSHWDWTGKCIDGPLQGAQLKWLQSYQEYWHSWRTFRQKTEKAD